jgi:Protein of unknown function (DUF664)
MSQTMAVNELTTPGPAAGSERAELLATLATHRDFLRFTTRDLSDEQARERTTASELCLGGLIKRVAAVERSWADFILEGPSAMGDFSAMTEADFARRGDEFRLLPGETLAGSWPTTPRWPAGPTNWSPPCPAWTPRGRCRAPRGASPVPGGRPAGCCCTSSPRPRSTPATRRHHP